MAALAALALTGCGGNSEAAAPTTSASPEDAYIAQIEQTIPSYDVEPHRDGLIDRGYEACGILDRGSLTEDEIVTTWANSDHLGRDLVETALQSARDNFCPDL